jgi:hypothetical protein
MSQQNAGSGQQAWFDRWLEIASRRSAALATEAGRVARAVLRDPAGPVIAAVLVIAILLRAYFVLRWHPALVNYSDTGIYIQGAYSGGFSDPLRVVGYALFLIPLHWLTPHLLPVVVVQHAMGLATAVLLYLTVWRCGAPRVVALLALAGVALGGTQIFLEHAILSEALFTFLVALSLYAAVRASQGSAWWAVLAGISVGLSVTVRGAGMVLIPVFALWLPFAAGRVTRDAMLRAGAALLASLAIIGGYIGWRHAETGLSGLTTNGNWNLYGRVAPFADCTQFTPPSGTEGLCDSVPPDQRHGRNVEWYIFIAESPAQKLFGPPYQVSADPDANEKLGKFSLAAIRAQPGDYLNDVWDDLIRIVDSDHPSNGDLSFEGLISFLLHDADRDDTNPFVEYWRQLYYPGDRYRWEDIGILEDWERATRAQGPLIIALLLLAGAAPWTAPKSSRRPALLLAASALALLIFPILTHAFDARFVVPALGPLFAAAALGVWGLFPAAARLARAARER